MQTLQLTAELSGITTWYCPFIHHGSVSTRVEQYIISVALRDVVAKELSANSARNRILKKSSGGNNFFFKLKALKLLSSIINLE